MSQIKIYALNKTIELHRIELSKAIHQALVKVNRTGFVGESIF